MLKRPLPGILSRQQVEKVGRVPYIALLNTRSFSSWISLGSITSRCSGNEPALLPPKTEEIGGNRA